MPAAPDASGLSLLIRAAAAIALGAVLGLGLGTATATLRGRRAVAALLAGGVLGLLIPADGLGAFVHGTLVPGVLFLLGVVLACAWPGGSLAGIGRDRATAPPREPGAQAFPLLAGAAALAVLGAAPLLLRVAALSPSASPELSRTATALAVATLGAGRVLASRRAHGLVAVLGAAVAGGSVVLALERAPLLLERGIVVLPALLAVGSLGAGAALAVSARRAPRNTAVAAALAAVLAPGVSPLLARSIARSWSEGDRAWLAVGAPAGEREGVAARLASGALALRSFELGGSSVVAVVDSKAGNVRELRRDGKLLGTVVAGPGETKADVLTPVLAGILAETLGPGGGHVAVLGFGDGIAAGTIASHAGLSDLFLVEPDARIRALRSDPGDPFHGAWTDKIATIVAEDAGAFLARTKDSLAAVVDLEGALARTDVLEIARGRASAGAPVLRVVREGPGFAAEARAFARAFPGALAFHAPRAEDVAILVGGVAPLESSRLAVLEEKREGLGKRLALTKIPARDLLGTWVAGAGGLARAGSPRELAPTAEDVLELERFLGAAGDEKLADRPSPAAQEALVRVADSAGKLGFARVARAILEAARARRADSIEVVRGLGDCAFHEGRDDEAVKLWNEALALDPRALTPRISLAVRHLRRKELAPARTLLREALSGDRRKDAPVHYLLGQVAFDEQDYSLAKEEFQNAAGFEDAAYRTEIASQLELEKESMGGGPRSTAVAEKDSKRLVKEARAVLDGVFEQEQLAKSKGLVLDDSHRALHRSRRDYARGLLDQALKQSPNDAAVAFDVGLLRAGALLGEPADREAARLAFENAAQLDPANGKPLLALGDLLREAGDDAAALDAYQRGLSRGPVWSGSARAYLSCADLLRKKGDFAEAARMLEEADRVVPGHPTVVVNLAAFYEKLARTQDAIRTYERWLDLVGEGADPEERRRVEAALQRLRAR